MHRDEKASRGEDQRNTGLWKRIYIAVTMATRKPRMAFALRMAMKTHGWQPVIGDQEHGCVRKTRSKLAGRILRAAYQRFAKDSVTRLAVKRCLR
jgi:hypothetical protein